MKTHSLFPTLVCEWHNPNKDQFKKTFFDSALVHFDANGYSHELTKSVDIHLNPAFEDFFNTIGNNAKKYLDLLGIEPDIFDINLVKSWLNVTREMHTPTHAHADSHLSFVYYVNIPQGIEKPIIFSIDNPPNNLFHNMGQVSTKQGNMFNCVCYGMNPVEGQMLMFPGKLQHTTGGYGSGVTDPGIKTAEDLKSRKVAIAGDFFLTYKEKAAKSFGIQPVSNWKVY